MNRYWFLLVGILAIAVIPHSSAQTIPPPSRTIYKCEEGGKVVYSDSPCLGAKRLDVQPTRGLNKATGAERVGADVRQERHNEAMAEALRPLLGETADQRETRHRRTKLGNDERLQCGRLDRDIAAAEHGERLSTPANRDAVQSQLFGLRKQYRNLRC